MINKDKERVLNEINCAKDMIKMLLDQMEKLEQRVYSGAISNEDAVKFARSWENAIQQNYKSIDILIASITS